MQMALLSRLKTMYRPKCEFKKLFPELNGPDGGYFPIIIQESFPV
jgi:hypothetical protein